LLANTDACHLLFRSNNALEFVDKKSLCCLFLFLQFVEVSKKYLEWFMLLCACIKYLQCQFVFVVRNICWYLNDIQIVFFQNIQILWISKLVLNVEATKNPQHLNLQSKTRMYITNYIFKRNNYMIRLI
jgi:hypothetical protein